MDPPKTPEPLPKDATDIPPTTSQYIPTSPPDTITLRDIITNDHFGGSMSPSIIEAWVSALQPSSQVPLPPNVKGFYGGSLKACMPIEIARGSYKFIAHETADQVKIRHYAERMLMVLGLLDVEMLARTEQTTALLALWHRALALVRLSEGVRELEGTLSAYEELRPRSSLSDSKLPYVDRLKTRLLNTAEELGNVDAVKLLSEKPT